MHPYPISNISVSFGRSPAPQKRTIPRGLFPLTHLADAVVRGIEIAFEYAPAGSDLDSWLVGSRADLFDCETLNDICLEAVCSPCLQEAHREALLIAYSAINALLCLDSPVRRHNARTAMDQLSKKN